MSEKRRLIHMTKACLEQDSKKNPHSSDIMTPFECGLTNKLQLLVNYFHYLSSGYHFGGSRKVFKVSSDEKRVFFA